MVDGVCAPQPNYQEFEETMSCFAAIGGTAAGGVTRLAVSKEDGRARDEFVSMLKASGATVTIDQVGNIFGLFDFGGSTDDFIMCGSHLDSQPKGGRFDGTYGVLAALIAAKAINEHAEKPARNLVIVNWTNEEGARFQPSLLGSSCYAGHITPEFALSRTDADGETLAAALKAIGYDGAQQFKQHPNHYVELHVEQGRILEKAGKQIGAVTGCWATKKVRVRFKGEASHTGPTPMDQRRDALHAASRAIVSLHDIAGEYPGLLHVSSGRMEIEPNSPNVVASQVDVWFEIRAENDQGCDSIVEQFNASINQICNALGVVHEIIEQSQRTSTELPSGGVELTRSVARRLQLNDMCVRTVAGHDAITLAMIVPTILIFVPSVGGYSHCEEELTINQDLEAGLATLTGVLWRLLNQPTGNSEIIH